MEAIWETASTKPLWIEQWDGGGLGRSSALAGL